MAKFLSWGRQQLRTSRGYAVPDLTRYGYGHGAGTTGMRIGLRPAPDGVALHTVTHSLYRVGQGVCPFAHSTVGLSVNNGWPTVGMDGVWSSELVNLKK